MSSNLLIAARRIAATLDRAEAERGGPIKAHFKKPSTRNREQNRHFIPVADLRALRAAVQLNDDAARMDGNQEATGAMDTPPFKCPCCGVETAVIANIDEVAERFAGLSRILIEALSKGRWMSRDALFQVLYSHRADGGPECSKVIGVRMHQLKKHLLPFGYTIESTFRGGSTTGCVYRITPVQTVAT
tara:strand:- start:20473 stop:21036 length:564 start_codon:yes stop_codon:yes gene_type:complete